MSADWQSRATITTLKKRGQLLKTIRNFFDERNVWEVETPLLSKNTVTDPYIDSIAIPAEAPLYLQTSPEYGMKRLLASGSGSIFQICKAFRQEELGRFHHHEFTMLEWYRIGFDHLQLMEEVDELLQLTLMTQPAEKLTYQQVFQKFLDIDPFHITSQGLAEKVKSFPAFADISGFNYDDKDACLQLLLSEVEPSLGQTRPCFIYNYPSTQAALAKCLKSTPPVAARFEVYVKGLELANGFYELQDEKEQRQRFIKNMATRKTLGKDPIAIDELFLDALKTGLPECAGVAMGIDRLAMLAFAKDTIEDVISFR